MVNKASYVVGLALLATGLLGGFEPASAQAAAGCAAGDRYEDKGDGTVLDCRTGLYWLKDAKCLTGGIWSAAKDKAAALQSGQCGLADGSKKGDWRLPTKEEFCSLGVAGACPAANASSSLIKSGCAPATLSDRAGAGCWATGNPFVGVQQGPVYGFWSGTEESLLNGWAAFLKSGEMRIQNKGAAFFTWPVRGALQSGDKLVFVTSVECAGNFGECASTLGLPSVSGIAAGDAICNKLARDAGLGGDFRAWLSDSKTAARTRMNLSAGPYLNRNGERVGDNLESILAQGGLKAGVGYNERGQLVSAQSLWTGTNRGGQYYMGYSCRDWSNSVVGPTFVWEETAGHGVPLATDSTWTEQGGSPCNGRMPFYCFQT